MPSTRAPFPRWIVSGIIGFLLLTVCLLPILFDINSENGVHFEFADELGEAIPQNEKTDQYQPYPGEIKKTVKSTSHARSEAEKRLWRLHFAHSQGQTRDYLPSSVNIPQGSCQCP
jgi:hypothetical protein